MLYQKTNDNIIPKSNIFPYEKSSIFGDVIVRDSLPRFTRDYSKLGISEYFLTDKTWIQYSQSTTKISYSGIFRFVLVMSFLTNIAYTYYLTGKKEYKVHSGYMRSLYTPDIEYKQYNSTMSLLHGSTSAVSRLSFYCKMADTYMKLSTIGTMEYKDFKKSFTVSSWCMRDNFISDIDKIVNSNIIVIDIKPFNFLDKLHSELVNNGLKEKDSSITKITNEEYSKYFVIDENKYVSTDLKHSFKTLKEAKQSNIEYFNCGYGYRILIGLKLKTVDFLKYINPKKNVKNDYSHSCHIDSEKIRHLIERNKEQIIPFKEQNSLILKNEEILSFQYMLMRMVKDTITIQYKRRDFGRYYCIDNPLQRVNKNIRKYLLSDYTELDMNCAVFTILLNLALNRGYDGNVTVVREMIDDKRKFRYDISQELNITENEVKLVLTGIAFGIKATAKSISNIKKFLNSNNELIFTDKNNKFKICSFLKPYDEEHPEDFIPIDTLIDILEHQKIKELMKEMNSINDFLLEQKEFYEYKTGKKYLVNKLINKKFDITNGLRISKPKKIAFLYQSFESYIMDSLLTYFKKDDIGLLLHDGIYVKKDVDIQSLENYVYEKTHMKIKFSQK